MEPKPASASQVSLALVMGPMEANLLGFVHGGVIMRLCDEAAGAASARHCRTACVTALVDRMAFLVPVEVGDLLTLKASVNAAWEHSLEVGVSVEAENLRTGVARHANSSYFTMVALDSKGRPQRVPPLLVETDEGRKIEHEAQLRREARLAERGAARRSS